MPDAEEKPTMKDQEPVAAPEPSRRASTASTLLPAYKASDDPPPYREETVSSSPRKSQQQPHPSSSSAGHEGSCGMPASTVMGVLSASSDSRPKATSNTRPSGAPNAGGNLSSQARDRLISNHFDRTRRRWNSQGTTLIDFGNPFRRSGR